MSIDWAKPIETMAGEPARVVHLYPGSEKEWPRLVVCGTGRDEYCFWCTEDGRDETGCKLVRNWTQPPMYVNGDGGWSAVGREDESSDIHTEEGL